MALALKKAMLAAANKPDVKAPAAAEPKEAEPAPSLGNRKLSSLLGKKGPFGSKRDDSSEISGDESGGGGGGGGGFGAKRGSIMASMMSMSQRTSISTASGKQGGAMGLMASRRFARKLFGRALEKRESTIGDAPPPVNYEPTYRMGPKQKFETSPVLDIVKEVIDGRLEGMKYSARLTPNINKVLSDEIKDKVKTLKYDRYKIIVVVTIGEKKGQGVMASSRCSWDDKTDNFVSHTFQNKQIFCTCNVFGVFKE